MKLVERLHAPNKRFRVELGTDLLIDQRDRRNAARAETINDFEGELVVRRGFAGCDADRVLERLQVFRC